MPWITDANGEKVYKPSMYTKEELPTWSEIYEEFYLKKYYEDRKLDPDNERWMAIDPYWEISRYKVLLATVCNQFNKMLFEDDFKDTLIKAIIDSDVMGRNSQSEYTITNIQFICDWRGEDVGLFVERSLVMTDVPPIYTIPHPEGKTNPFIVTNQNRVNITTLTVPPVFAVVIERVSNKDPHVTSKGIAFAWGRLSKLFEVVLETMIEPYRRYFEGPGVGWKDENGNLISEIPHKSAKCPSGFDPAL